jgi:DNA-binding CsgD family transcriptional regulator
MSLEAELAAWTAYLNTGSMRRAAQQLGVHEVTVRKRIAALKDRYNVTTTAQLALVLERADSLQK